MTCRTPILLLALALPLLAGTLAAAAEVQFELITEPGFPITGSREWIELMKDLDQSGLRIREGRSGERPEIKTRGTERLPIYNVVGVLTAGNTLRVPGASFSLRDKAKLAAWIAKLKEGGEEGLSARVGAFGMTSEQLVAVHDALDTPIEFATAGRPAAEVARQIAIGLPLKIEADNTARRALAGNSVVEDELQGLSGGTALAAVLRPLGIVLVPQKAAGGQLQLAAVDARAARESWPVGWPVEGSPREALPELFSFLTVEINDVTLREALQAIQQRLQVPILYDHNALAREEVSVDEQKVSLPARKMFYQQVLDRLLFQARLKSDLRMDEAGKAFLWITSIRSPD